jgi:hypothetical protein
MRRLLAHRAGAVAATREVEAVLSLGAVLAVGSGAALVVTHLANAMFFDTVVLDANGEGTVWTWLSVVAAAGVAGGAALRAVWVRAERRVFIALAVSAAFLSMDDLTVLHERVSGRVYARLGLSDSWDSVVWPVIYLPVLTATVLLGLVVARGSLARTRRFIHAGLALLALSVLLEVVSAPWSGREENTVHTVEGALEEAAELAGWMLLAAAVLARALHDLIEQTRSR